MYSHVLIVIHSLYQVLTGKVVAFLMMKYFIVFILSVVVLGKPTVKNPMFGDLPEGDILVELTGGKVVPPSRFNAVWDERYLWKTENGNEEQNVLYYDIVEEDYTRGQLDSIDAAVKDIEDSTMVDGQRCVELRRIERNGNTVPENYVLITSDSGCYSYIGRQDAAQLMSLVIGCFAHGTIMHEFLHALGFHHEHKRADRDDYVTITWDNIEPGYIYNFVKLVENETVDHLETPYDYGSVMHYPRTAFAIDPEIDTITPREDVDIGQVTHLSELDKERIQILYGCLNIADSKFYKGWTEEDIFKPIYS